MGKQPRYTEAFRQESANQVIQHGYSVQEVSQRLGVSDKSLYNWIKKYRKAPKIREEISDLQVENAQLKRELKRLQQERDILKEAAVFFAGESKSATPS